MKRQLESAGINLEELKKKRQAEKRITHPLCQYDLHHTEKYNHQGLPVCRVCKVTLKGAEYWQGHLEIEKLKRLKAEKEQRAKEEAEQRKAASLAPKIHVVAEEVLSEDDATAREEREKVAQRAADTKVSAVDDSEQAVRAEMQERLIAEEEVNAIAPRKVESRTTDIALALPTGFFDNQDEDDRIHRRLTKEQRTKLLSEKTAELRDETERIRIAETAVDKGDDDDGIDAELRVDPEENVLPAVQTAQADFPEVRKLVMDAHDLEKETGKEGEAATEEVDVDDDELLSWKSKSLW